MNVIGPGALRALAAAGALMAAAGWALGWFERSAPAVGSPVTVVRPDGLTVVGPLAWVLAVPVVLAPLLPRRPRALLAGAVAVLPALAAVAVAGVLRPRAAVRGETLQDLVQERPLGQGLALLGVLFVLMALVTAWRRMPDWRVLEQWRAADAHRTAGDG